MEILAPGLVIMVVVVGYEVGVCFGLIAFLDEG